MEDVPAPGGDGGSRVAEATREEEADDLRDAEEEREREDADEPLRAVVGEQRSERVALGEVAGTELGDPARPAVLGRDRGVQADGGLSAGLAMLTCLLVVMTLSLRPRGLFMTASRAGGTLSGSIESELTATQPAGQLLVTAEMEQMP
jgi:hypothetical protein